MIKYSELIKEEKEDPQGVFNKTHKCSKCGHCEYERWVKIKNGEYEDDGRCSDKCLDECIFCGADLDGFEYCNICDPLHDFSHIINNKK